MAIFNPILFFVLDVYRQLLAANDPFYAILILLVNGFWIPIAFIIYKNAEIAWKDWRQSLYHNAKRRFILLAIDVPRLNEQSPKAVESIFTQLHGALPGRNNIYENWWVGKNVDYFSVELVSIEGYVQFLVHTQEEYRDMVESAFYSQYPDAEITQVEDYVYGQNGEFKDLVFPNKEYDLFGCEFVLARSNAYPIRLHIAFEHSLSQEFKDPMASLLESMNKIGPGEQLWFQWVITPEYDDDWQSKSNKEAMKIAGKKIESSENIVDRAVSTLINMIDAIGIAVFPFYNQTEESKKDDEMLSLMLHLTPAEQGRIEGIQMKADKHGFWTKFRYLYIAKKAVASKARGLAPIVGALKQFSSLNTNSLKTHKYTKTWGLDYLMVEQRIAARQNKLLRAFQDRGRSAGSNGIVLNTEELATLYHFPTETVKAPLVSRTTSKRGSAPVSLPVEGGPHTLDTSLDDQPAQPAEQAAMQRATAQEAQEARAAHQSQAPTNLPFV
ncbi:hypothetical protein BK004_02135 [bacterium CG10_46_32]|nr:MAG: hypothetical protein BK004_02135 [bacterium CG10_46_32]PIR56229.1 MAG: hypothetical protein COU73_02160 [Parcubacteria group bacterium CG10_big_fil_rev_8_21_14_0_10_46_32]